MIRLDILGPGSAVDRSGEPLDLSGLPFAVLAYLAVTARPIERDELATLFWPGSEPARRRHSLRQALSRIRSAVPDEVFESDGATIRIDPMQVETDREEFLEELSAGRVDKAVALWGGILLEGFRREGAWELGEWLERERTRLRDALIEGVLEFDIHSDVEELPMLRAAHRALPLEQRITLRYAAALIRAGREAEALPLVPLEDEQDPRVPWDDMLRDAREAQAASIREHATDVDRARERLALGTEPTAGTPGSRRLSRPALVFLVLLAIGLVGVPAVAIFNEDPVEPPAATLFFCSDRAANGGDDYQLFRMDGLGVDKHRVTQAHVCGARPVSGDRLVGRSGADDGARLRVLGRDPENPIAEWQLVPAPELDTLVDVQMFDVAYLASGSRVVFDAKLPSDSTREVFLWDPARAEVDRLTKHAGEDDRVRFTPDGSVVFRSVRDGDPDIWIWSESEGVRPLVTSPAHERDPQLRGDTLLFLRGRGEGEEDGNIDIWLRDLATGHETRLTDNDWNDYTVDWSPNGRYLCWQSEEFGHYEMDVVVHDLETGNRWTVAGGPGRQSECQWDTESRGVYYIVWEGEGRDIYYVPLSGDARINVSRYPGLDGGLVVVPDTLFATDAGT